MRVITGVKDMRDHTAAARREGRTTGFVPTMGCLHEGHMSLVRAARAECDEVVMSVFVNPAQFGLGEDFDKYPRDMKSDKAIAENEGVDVLFTPSEKEMYPEGYSTWVEVAGSMTETMCGLSRPGHFRGVTTVVARLFNIVSPDRAYFGRKDAQQAAVIKRMVLDLDTGIDIRVMPIVREADGLAMSSRNKYLSEDERRKAISINRALDAACEAVGDGESRASEVTRKVESTLDGVKVDYIAVVDAETLEPLDEVGNNTLVAVAVFAGETRLIDNVIVNKGENAQTGV